MAGGIIYLDIDDEITSAAARVRAAEGRHVAVVLPYGSRVATSRINFRLLARDALTHEKQLSVVAGDPAARALAASAGLPVFATVAEYEAASGSGRAVGRPLEASATVVTPPAAADPPVAAPIPIAVVGADGETAPMAVGRASSDRAAPDGAAPDRAAPGRAAPARAASDEGARSSRQRRRGIGRASILLGAAVLALAVVVGGVAAYLVLPSATAVVTPREESIGPVALRISASTAIDAPDVAAGLVPARVVEVPVEAADTFPATGKRIEEASATGSVRFVNLDPTSKNTIDRGAIVSTAGGTRFRVERKVTVPAAELVFDPEAGKFTIQPATETVDVTAVDAGPEGNVEANTITTVPRGEEPLFLKVSNPDATRGGARTEFPRVKQEDVDAALTTLGATLTQRFTERLADPALVADETAVFPETGLLGTAVPSVDPDTLVGQEVATFELGATATGTVTTVDAAPVRAIAEARLAAEVDAGHQLIDGSSSITESPAVVEGGTITYPVVATARQVAILDPAELETQILGRSLAEARDILAGYGTVEIGVWPEWVTTIPTFDARVEVQVRAPVTIETPGASPSEAAP